MASQVATVGTGDDALNAFEEDLTLIRGIERLDAEMRDEKAFVNGYIEITTATNNTEKEDNTNTEGKDNTESSQEGV